MCSEIYKYSALSRNLVNNVLSIPIIQAEYKNANFLWNTFIVAHIKPPFNPHVYDIFDNISPTNRPIDLFYFHIVERSCVAVITYASSSGRGKKAITSSIK